MNLAQTLRNLRLSALLLAACVIIGTVGFEALGRDPFHAFYLTIVILTTVGMEGAETDAERAFALLLMIVGVGTVLYATSVVVAFFVEGEISHVFERRKTMQTIQNMSGHHIVIGHGRMGAALCMQLHYRDAPFVLIETDEHRIEDAKAKGYLVVEGDAMHEETLFKAGIERASAVAACLPKDADNVFVTLTAKGIQPDLTVIARAEQVRSEPKLIRAGASRVICPPLIGANRVTNLMLNPQVEEMMELDGHWPDLELSRVILTQFTGMQWNTVGELCRQITSGTSVVALVRADGTRVLRPEQDEPLSNSDELIVIGPRGCVGEMLQAMQLPKAA